MLWFLLLLILPLHASESSKERDYHYLDELSLEAGCDMSSHKHNYTEIYSELLHDYRDKKVLITQIGSSTQDTPTVWESFLPHSEIHLLDLEGKNKQYHRIYVHSFKKYDRSLLEQLLKKWGAIDIFIDNGQFPHADQLEMLEMIFPQLKLGGIYIIENTQSSYWQTLGGGGSPEMPLSAPTSLIENLKLKIDDLLYSAARTQIADPKKTPDHIRKDFTHWQRDLKWISFYKGLVVLKKRHPDCHPCK